MRRFAATLALLLAAGPSFSADRDEEAGCLAAGDAQEAVSSRKIVTPREAIVAARRAVPTGDVLRAALCRRPGKLVYTIMILRRDGRLVRVTVDASGGEVILVH